MAFTVSSAHPSSDREYVMHLQYGVKHVLRKTLFALRQEVYAWRRLIRSVTPCWPVQPPRRRFLTQIPGRETAMPLLLAAQEKVL